MPPITKITEIVAKIYCSLRSEGIDPITPNTVAITPATANKFFWVRFGILEKEINKII